MRPFSVSIQCLLAALLAGAGLLGGCATAPSAAFDLDGTPVDPFARQAAATVLIFISDDCPISNRYAPEIERLHGSYGPRGVNFWLVHADPDEKPAEIREHARQFNLTVPELRDPKHHLVKLARAEVTPSCAVFASGGTLAYYGRIDDRALELERERLQPTHRDLSNALDEVLSGRRVTLAHATAVGCFIPAAH